MRPVLALFAFAALWQSAPPDAPDATTAPQGQAVEAAPTEASEPAPWTAPLADGLAELRVAADARDRDAVLELAARLGRSARELERDPARAARVLHDSGLARAEVDDLFGALADLRAAAGLAGPGAVRESALYAAGTARLQRAELLRLAVPEIAEAQGLPAPEASEDEAAPDPLEVARQAYLDARADLLERLRLDARHADTRANLELVTRRLRELDQIERERQEEQQDEQQQQQQDQQDPPEDQQQDQQPSEDQEQQEQEQQDPSEDQQDQQEQESEEQEQDEEQPQEQPPEGESEEDQPQDEEQQEAQPEQAAEGELEERVLSKEEVQRLLDQLAEIEAEAEAVRARLRDRKRKPVEKDW